jgi:FkbM family methyltransferase
MAEPMTDGHVSRPRRGWYPLLKRAALRWLPEPLLQVAKRVHYARRLRHVDATTERDLAVVRRLVAEGDRVIDVGANIGVYTVALSRWVGPAGRVHAVEPVPPTFALLASTVKRLRLSNVQLHNVAASDRETAVLMEVPTYAEGGANFYESRISASSAPSAVSAVQRFAARAARLDEIIPPDPIAFVKMDVEGHELPALRGARAILETHRPALLIEISGNPCEAGSSAAEVFMMLETMGYGAWWFDGERLRRRGTTDRSTNWFFLTDARAERTGMSAASAAAPANRA